MNCLIISGMSGAGKSLAADVLEDIGYYCVDNMPTALIPRFIELFRGSAGKYKQVAFVVDVRGDAEYEGLFHTLDELRVTGTESRVLFSDCADSILINRHKTTRRRHPLDAEGLGLSAAVEAERLQLEPVRRRADYLVDTTHLSNSDLRHSLLNLFAGEGGQPSMTVGITTFGFKHGIPHDADLVFDVRFLANPYYIAPLRDLDGRDEAVYQYVFADPDAEVFCHKLLDMLAFLIPRYLKEGKASLSIAIGCTGGHHRSISIARWIQSGLREVGYDAFLRHRDVGKGHT